MNALDPRSGGPVSPVLVHNDTDENLMLPDGRVLAPDCSIKLPGATLRDAFAIQLAPAVYTALVQQVAAHPDKSAITDAERAAFATATADRAYELADALVARGRQP